MMFSHAFHLLYRPALGLLLLALLAPAQAEKQVLDEPAAFISDRVITKRELMSQVAQTEAMLKSQQKEVPNRQFLMQQALQELIVRNLQLAEADQIGLVSDPQQLERAVLQIAENNNMSPDELRRQIEEQGQSYDTFYQRIKEDLLIRNLRQREVVQEIDVSEDEIAKALRATSKDADFRYSYLRIVFAEGAQKQQQALRTIAQIRGKVRQGESFEALARDLAQQDDARFYKTSWRPYAELPQALRKYLLTMAVGDLTPTIRSGKYLLLLQLNGKRRDGQAAMTQDQYLVRHIVMQTNPVNGDDKVVSRLERIKSYLKKDKTGKQEKDFAYFAKRYSQDPGSGFKGGFLGWVSPATMVPEFAAQLESASINEIVGPFRSKFGWHLLVVEDVREQDVAHQAERNAIINNIRQQKSQEEIRSWLLRLREKHFVDVRI